MGGENVQNVQPESITDVQNDVKEGSVTINTNANNVYQSATTPTVTFEDVMKFLSNAGQDFLLKIPAVEALVEKARSQEKDKLYKTIEAKDDTIKELKEQIKTLQKQLDELGNQNLSKEQVMEKQIKELTETIENLKAEIQAEREKAEKEKREAEFKAYKERRLRELSEQGIEYLPDLIGGDNEEEFEKSIEKSIQRYKELQEEFEKRLGKSGEKKASTPKTTNPAGSQVKALSIEDIRKMTPEEYAKHRAKILAEISKRQ